MPGETKALPWRLGVCALAGLGLPSAADFRAFAGKDEMHAPTHIMSGWCVGNLFRLTAGERACCMIAASAADVDAVSRVFGEEAYWDWHHVAGHNLPSRCCCRRGWRCSRRHRLKALLVYLALAHLHLVLDYFGSGPGWAIRYGWPLFQWDWQNADAWEFSCLAEPGGGAGAAGVGAGNCGRLRADAGRIADAGPGPAGGRLRLRRVRSSVWQCRAQLRRAARSAVP